MEQPDSMAPEPSAFDARFREKLLDLLIWRRDVRHFKRDPLPDGAVERLIGIACLSPSVGLSEPWRFVLVEDRAKRDVVRACFEACNAEALSAQRPRRMDHYARLKLAGLDDAPCQIAVFADRQTEQGHGLGRNTMPEAIDYSAAIAIHTLWLVARAEGLGIGWVSILDPDIVRAVLEVPEDWRLIGYLCLGYPETVSETPLLEKQGWESRRAAEDVIYYR